MARRIPRTAQILADLRSPAPDAVVSDLPGRLVTMCAACVPVTGAGIIVMSDAGPGAMLASTDGAAQIMEELQFTLGEGPCVDASTSGRPVLQPDLAAPPRSVGRASPQERWPRGCGRSSPSRCRSGASGSGSWISTGTSPVVLDDRELAEALAFADAATAILLQLQSGTDGVTGEPGLLAMIEDRAEVHQATGMVSVQAGLGLAASLVLLRAHSYAAERPILDVAREVIGRTLRFDPEDDHHE